MIEVSRLASNWVIM